MSATPRTGLNSYLVALQSGEYVRNAALGSRGWGRDSAQVFLWEPEAVADRLADLGKRAPWIGARPRAERARP